MTTEDFNIKYRAWAKEGFENQLLMFDNDRVATFLDSVFIDFIRIPDFEFSQIKIKFGNARFYSNLGNQLSAYVECSINELI